MMGENGDVIRLGLRMMVEVNGVPFVIDQVRRTRLTIRPMARYRQAGNVVMEVDRVDAEAAIGRGLEAAQREIVRLDEERKALRDEVGLLREALEFYADEETYLSGEIQQDWGVKARGVLKNDPLPGPPPAPVKNTGPTEGGGGQAREVNDG